ncbi:MAG: M23 family metallopeptidase [Deltaproteobacteria bacterium]|jgi:murein DD-endopeptidase MepM/ murein hydrolase activator NlpD
MPGKTYQTLLFMPSSPEKRIVKISLPSFLWMIFCCAFVATLFLGGAGTWSMYRFHRLAQRSYYLEKENQSAKFQVEEQRKKIDHLNKELLKIREKAGFIQNFLGLEPQGSGQGTIGQGGLEIAPQDFHSESDLSGSENLTLMNAYRSNFSDFLSPPEIRRLDGDLQEIITTLQERRDKLEHTPSISPVDPQHSWISSPFGMRISPFTGKKQFHTGIDIAGWKGTPIVAPAKGKVVFVGKNGSLGLTVKIRHNAAYETEYGHLLKASVKKGQNVERGEMIACMGNSGRSTGYHLHYELHKNGKCINPFHHMMDWDQNLLLTAQEE